MYILGGNYESNRRFYDTIKIRSLRKNEIEDILSA